MDPERVADYECETGEGPLWHPDEERLYWTDIPRGRLYRYDPETDEHERVYDGDVVGGFTVQENGDLLLFMERGSVGAWNADEGFVGTVVEEIPAERDSRFNDVVADPEGRVYCGTMPADDRLGRLYRLDRDGSLARVVEGLDIPNGMGFTPDRERFYLTESEAKAVYRFDYDRASGALSNRETFLDLTDESGIPDGLTVDEDGDVWSARWDGGCLVRYTSAGEEAARVDFPARKVSSVTFAGPEYADAYVTTAGGDDREREGDGAGALFRLTPPVGGVPEFRSRIDV